MGEGGEGAGVRAPHSAGGFCFLTGWCLYRRSPRKYLYVDVLPTLWNVCCNFTINRFFFF